ncbi:MAG: hypothetical protein FWB90_03860 [Fibromonadales bacterium]|nr:hypothetical protein [Fibromonadales bacterium]
MRTFAERAIAEGKRLGKDIEIRRNGNSMEYWIDGNLAKSESLGSFSQASAKPDCKDSFNPTSTDKAISEYRIGISGISGETYFAACGARGYCAAAIKAKDNNSMIACIKRGNSANAKWEAL